MIETFKNKTVLITGGSSGIGLGIARAFAQQGANVCITGRDSKKLFIAVEGLKAEGLHVVGFVADVADKASVTQLISNVAESNGGIDILCCNAGVFPSDTLENISENDWDQVFSINVKGNFLCVQAALPYLKHAEYGRVILTSSITGPITGFPGWAHYASSKAAQLGFMRTAAIELAKDGITINAVLPGNILTEGLIGMGESYIASMASSVPMKRLGTVEDIAHSVLFFASKEAAYVTAQSLVIDGGQVLPESLQALA